MGERGQLILGKIIKIVANRCQILRQNAPNRLSAGVLPQTPLGELTALPRPPSWILERLLLREGRVDVVVTVNIRD